MPTFEPGPSGPVRHALTGVAASVVTAATLVIGTLPAPMAEVPSPAGEPAPAPAPCRHPWIAPVDAPITDPYRPPDHRYGPGNRGIEYGTEPGQGVVAVASGVVEFAGPVGGRPVVVVDHGGGLRSSYVNLRRGLVTRGDVVVGGQPIAVAEASFHLGARRDGVYIDPATLIDELCVVVRLVPLPDR